MNAATEKKNELKEALEQNIKDLKNQIKDLKETNEALRRIAERAKKGKDEALMNAAIIILGKLRIDPAFVIPAIINIMSSYHILVMNK